MNQLVNRPVFNPEKPACCPAYLDWVRTLPCAVTGLPAECAHHLIGHGRLSQRRSSDFFAFPLINILHDEQHSTGIHRLGVKKWEHLHGSQWEHVARTLEKFVKEARA